jgi:hypothetical protein
MRSPARRMFVRQSRPSESNHRFSAAPLERTRISAETRAHTRTPGHHSAYLPSNRFRRPPWPGREAPSEAARAQVGTDKEGAKQEFLFKQNNEIFQRRAHSLVAS